MTFNKNRIVSWRKYGDNILTPSWVAGNNHTRSALSNFKRDEIEAIDIVGLCDHLRSCNTKSENNDAINSNQKPKPPLIPFKVFSRMVFGTLLIFRQQVNNLLEDTERLLQNNYINGYSYDCCKTETTRKSLKRKTLISNSSECFKVPLVKKLCLTPVITNYTELLNEADLLPVSTSSDLTFDESITCTESYSIVRNGDHLQMREKQIMVRELNVELSSPTDYLEQQSFGNATQEELDQLIDLFSEKSTGLSFLKRKLILEREHSSAKVANTEFNPATYDVNHNNCFASDHDNKYNDALQVIDNTPEKNFNKLYQDNSLQDLVANTTNVPQSETLPAQSETLPAQSPCLSQLKLSTVLVTKQLRKKKKTKPKVVTDKRSRLSCNQLRAQLVKYHKYVTSRPKPEIPRKRGSELLETFKLKHIFPDVLPKQIQPSAESVSAQYTNLLRDIFGAGYNEDIANEIDTTRNESAVTLCRRKHNQAATITTQTVYVLQEPIDYIQNSENIRTMANIDIDNSNNNNCSSNESPNDYTVYGTMMQLLHTWRNQDSDIEKIDANAFLKMHPNRILSALSYYNLLELTRDLFIILTTKVNSIEIAKILLGSKSEKLITELNF